MSQNSSLAWRELVVRCRPASFVYVPAVAIIAGVSPVSRAHPLPTCVMVLFAVLLTGIRFIDMSNLLSAGDSVAGRRRFACLAVLNGALWSCFAAWACLVNEGWRSWFVAFLVAVIHMGSLFSMTPVFRVFLAFNLSIAIPLELAFLMSNRDFGAAMAVAYLSLMVLLGWMGWVLSRDYWHRLLQDRRRLVELASARERLQMVVEGSNLGAFDWDIQNDRVYFDEKLPHALELPVSEFQPHHGDLAEFLFPEDRVRMREQVVRHLKRLDSPLCEMEVRFRSASGECHWFAFRGKVVERSGAGLALRMAGTYEDITRSRQAEAALAKLERSVQQAEKLKTLGILAGGVAHDFNNLLAAMVGYLELAEDEPNRSVAGEHLRDARSAAMDASQLCDQLLTYAGKGQFRVTVFSITRVIEDMAHLIRVSLGKSLRLRLDLDGSLPTVEGDLTQIRQVVLNLLTNAADAMDGSSGEIVLKTALLQAREVERVCPALPTGDYVSIEVIDRGCGMDSDTQRQIFDPFFTTKCTGRGLGLSSALGIAHAHGGRLQVESQPGQGTRFQLLLPVSHKSLEVTRPAASGPRSSAAARILLVDDEEAVRKVATKMLARHGYEVHSAVDGVDALEKLRELSGELGLVVLDLTMPHKGGYQTLKELRAEWPHLPVILSSGYSEENVLAKAEAEIQGFLKKPFNREQLLKEVDNALSHQPS